MSADPICSSCGKPTTVRIGEVRKVCQCRWTHYADPSPPPSRTSVLPHLTEADVRRIVREELAKK